MEEILLKTLITNMINFKITLGLEVKERIVIGQEVQATGKRVHLSIIGKKVIREEEKVVQELNKCRKDKIQNKV